MLNDETERGCRTWVLCPYERDDSNETSFICTIDRDFKDIVRLRSYNLPDKPSIYATKCRAALATSAATTFFDLVSIGDRKFADEDLHANCLVDKVEGETSNIWCSELET